MFNWYVLLNELSASLNGPITQLSNQIGIPLITVFLLGLLGATSPCQFSTNTGAIALITKSGLNKRKILFSVLGYVTGKVIAYSLIGSIIILLGANLQKVSIPVIEVVRKLLGPMLVITGLYLLNWLPLRIQFILKTKVTRKFRVTRNYFLTSLSMGGFLALAFCPTLYLLFFGIVLPLGLNNSGGVAFPAVFALGSSVPLILFVLILIFCSELIVKTLAPRINKLNSYLKVVAGALFILAGVNDILLYLS